MQYFFQSLNKFTFFSLDFSYTVEPMHARRMLLQIESLQYLYIDQGLKLRLHDGKSFRSINFFQNKDVSRLKKTSQLSLLTLNI